MFTHLELVGYSHAIADDDMREENIFRGGNKCYAGFIMEKNSSYTELEHKPFIRRVNIRIFQKRQLHHER